MVICNHAQHKILKLESSIKRRVEGRYEESGRGIKGEADYLALEGEQPQFLITFFISTLAPVFGYS